MDQVRGKAGRFAITKVPLKGAVWRGFGREKSISDLGPLTSDLGFPTSDVSLMQKLLQVLPFDEDDVIVCRGLLEFGARCDVVIPPLTWAKPHNYPFGSFGFAEGSTSFLTSSTRAAIAR